MELRGGGRDQNGVASRKSLNGLYWVQSQHNPDRERREERKERAGGRRRRREEKEGGRVGKGRRMTNLKLMPSLCSESIKLNCEPTLKILL